MPIKSLKAFSFSVFLQEELEFTEGINVFIGENATGKSHLMKLLYSVAKSCERDKKRNSSGGRRFEALLYEKLLGVFRPADDNLGRLCNRWQGRNDAFVGINFSQGQLKLRFSNVGDLEVQSDTLPRIEGAVFIPAQEVLSIFEGFHASYENRELSFDETYDDLCVALSAKVLRGKRQAESAKLLRPLEKILQGKVRLDGERFYLASDRFMEGKLEAHLLAEGHRKIATIARLIMNGSLSKKGILFWDEPEAHLNPKLIPVVAKTLIQLANMGMQVFIATHDYLLSNELSLAVEYNRRPKVPIRFFSFNRGKPLDRWVNVQAGDTLADLESNSILEEFADHYDRERALFSKNR